MRWRCLVDKRRCFSANLGSEIKELKDLQRQRSWMSNFTGILHKISATRSNGSVGSGAACSESNVRVSVNVTVSVFVVEFGLRFVCLQLEPLTTLVEEKHKPMMMLCWRWRKTWKEANIFREVFKQMKKIVFH